jgi:putative heme-binding domain-containing protein
MPTPCRHCRPRQSAFAILFLAFIAVASMFGQAAIARGADVPFELRSGDHVSIIGNTMADRMQHDAWLETYIHALYPELDLTIRNLGFPGDEVKTRSREENFGSPDQWLTKTKSDVVFCFFGYNESLRGEAGLAQFRNELAEMLDGMLAKRYNGNSAPRIVLFSPIAHENHNSPHLPDGVANNRNLAIYTEAMRAVAAEKSVTFVDLFSPSNELFKSSPERLTINGIHLSEDGGREIARVIVRKLFGADTAKLDSQDLTALREAIQERNYYWFSRYRVVDGYNVFGGRSQLAWFGQSNADVMMREMEIFDVMTANRDQRVWAVARGSDIEVRDDNLPPQLEVKTNKPGDREDGSYSYLGGEEAIGKMKVAPGMKVNLFASEEMFPELVNPVQMAVDTDGDLYVAVWPSYPHWNPTLPREDRILRLRDEDGDGVADDVTIFADELNSVTGFEFWGGGMLVAALPELWFLKDTTGDGKADVKVRMLQGLSSADSHHSANAMLLGPDGWLYWSRGIFNVAAIETPTKTFRSEQTGVHRFNPRTFEMEFHFPIGPNPHGDVFDQWGYQFANDGTTGTGSYVNIGKGIGNKQWYQMRVRPVSSTGILSSSHFPDEKQGNFLIANTIGFLGVLQHEIRYDGADISAVEIEPILVSDDPNFRPSDLEIGSDGALYVADWANALIGHMQHNMRDPNRDDRHGRIYRVTYPDRPLVKPLRLKGKPIEEVLNAFYAKENSARYRARIELSGRETGEVVQKVLAWAAGRDASNPDDAQALLEALWVIEEHRVPNLELVKAVLGAEEPRVRAAAIRTLGHWAGRIDQWQPTLIAAAADPSPLVRAEAVKAAVEFPAAESAEAVLVAYQLPTDAELDTVLAYAIDRLAIDQQVRQMLRDGQPLSDAAVAYIYQNGSAEDLALLPPSAVTFEAILSRENLPADLLGKAIEGLAKIKGGDPLAISLQLWGERDAAETGGSIAGLGQWLLGQSRQDLSRIADRLEALAVGANKAASRQLAFALLVNANDSGDRAFSIASRSETSLRDLIASISQIQSDEVRAKLYPVVRSIIAGASSVDTGAGNEGERGIRVDFFYPNPPDVATETLAKLTPNGSGVVPEIVMNVPQKTQNDQFALRFTGMISVPKSGAYTFFISSDDGSRLYINDTLVVNNDGLHGMSEKSGTIDLGVGMHKIVVTYFDNGGGDGLEVYWSGPEMSKRTIAADRLFVIDETESIRDLAVKAMARIPGSTTDKWNDLTSLVKAGQSRSAAISILRTIPSDQRPLERAGDLVDNLVAYLSDMPAAMRTGDAAAEVIELIRSLASGLPAERAAEIEARLENLDVRVIAIGTVQERMIFDKELIVVQTGKPVEFRFSNSDFMPHNFVIVQPGSLEEIGELAEATARTADAKDRHYVPASPKVILASRLLESNQSQSLLYQAPEQPGIYPYVCTYPGHWRRMFGALYVVADTEAFSADPQAYLAEHPMEIRDDMLRFVSRNTEWKFDDLVGKVSPIPAGRSFEVGRNLFRAANCVGCHQFGGEGHALGPDLAKMEPKRQTVEHILRSIVEPSLDIDDKYRSYSFLLDSGRILTGTIVEETDSEFKVLVDPLAMREPLVINKDEVEEQSRSTVSIMPAGLLNKLTEEEIVDLVAYVFAGGDKTASLYEGGHDHHDGHGDGDDHGDGHDDDHDH